MSLGFSIALLVAALVLLGASVSLLRETRRLPTRAHKQVSSRVSVFGQRFVGPVKALRDASRKPSDLIAEAVESMRQTAPAIEVVENFDDFVKNPNSETLVVLLGCLSAPREIKELRANDYLAGQWLHNLPPDPWLGARLQAICFRHFFIWRDNRIAGFRYSATNPEESNTQSMDATTRVLSNWKDAIPYWNQVVEASFESLRGEFYDSSRRLFRLKPKAEGSVFGTFAAMSTIKTLLPSFSSDQLATLSPLVEAISRTLKDDSSLWELRDGIFGYRYEHQNEPCLSKTEYVYRIAGFEQEFLKKTRKRKEVQTPLFEHFARNSKGIVNLIRSCQQEDGAGFARSESQRDKPTTTHSRYAFQLMRGMLKDRLIGQRDLEWLRPVKILEFLLECVCDHGFADKPGKRIIPSLFGSRGGSNVIKLLEIGRLNGMFPDSKEYFYTLSKIAPMNPELAALSEECYDQEREAYWAWPTKYIRAIRLKVESGG